MRTRALLLALLLPTAGTPRYTAQPAPFTWQEVMVPMRDGVRLQTVILTPVGRTGPLPILFRRTPYGVPEQAPARIPESLAALDRDGYIFVIQNLRGRFKSEGTFRLTMEVDLTNATATNEVTDAYDSIDWLVKNIPNNNGRVGIYGVSYDGMTAAMTLLQPHPALKAVSEQASPADLWMNDDDHRYGALRLSYAFEYAVLEETDRAQNTLFRFDTYDTYSWYLGLGPLSNINARYLRGSLPYWNTVVTHPDYDAYWKREAWVNQLHAATVPTLHVAGFWDQEDPWGPWQIFRHAAEHDAGTTNIMVAGPWYHGQWESDVGDSIGPVPLGRPTGREFRENIQAPFFRTYLHSSGAAPGWKAMTFQTGTNEWRSYAAWPPPGATLTNLYLRADGTLSFGAPSATATGFREYVSDPANPVPYRPRPISPTYPGGDWPTWEVGDQRFVDGRPDVLTYLSAPLDRNLTVTGEVAADFFASTSGTDADFVVKLIDVYPDSAQPPAWDPDNGPAPSQYGRSMNGYELAIAMEVRRGRYNTSYERATALVPNRATEWRIPLRDRDHVFLRGHRLMVQVQSTWFPLIDRNPQRFVPSIYEARTSDFVKATQRVYSTPAMPSRIILPVMP